VIQVALCGLMPSDPKPPQPGRKRIGQAENWGQPLGGTDFLLARSGGGFKPGIIQAAQATEVKSTKRELTDT
jgi:hypothetical protein